MSTTKQAHKVRDRHAPYSRSRRRLFMNIIGTGLSGLVGSRIVELLSSKYTFEDVSYATGIDITDRDAVLKKIASSSASVVFHLAAKTDVDGCESERDLGQESVAWKINVIGTKHVVDACQQTGKKLIYISTDMVFDGEKKLGEKYDETETPNPVNFYAQTKYEAEKIVQTLQSPGVIIRIAYPYRATFERNEYVRTFKNLLAEGKAFPAVTDHYFSPVFIDDLANVFDLFITSDATGIFHTVGDSVVSPYDCAIMIADIFGFDKNLIGKITREEYFKGRAKRGFNTALKSDKIKSLGIQMHSFEEGLREIKRQLEK